jgi:hypothetical protein
MDIDGDILIVSNNAFNITSNNGKTLLNIFNNFEDKKLHHLYFKNEIAKCNKQLDTFIITEIDIIYKILGYKIDKKNIIHFMNINNKKGKHIIKIFKNYKNLQIIRILREIIWSCGLWKTKKLKKWIKNTNAKKIFFVAGDSIFAYRIVDFIKKYQKAETYLFITEDYIIINSNNILLNLRKIIIKYYLKKQIKESNRYFVISEKMKKKYKNIFKKEANIIFNVQKINYSLNGNDIDNKEKSAINITYIGGLHLSRFKVLNIVIKAINDIRERYGINIYLYIFANDSYLINNDHFWIIKGFLKKDYEIKDALNAADYLLFIENFEKKYRGRVEYAYSTKISEYISSGKPIIAVGPKYSCSIEELKDCAFICTSNKKQDIEITIKDAIYKTDLCQTKIKNAFIKYNKCLEIFNSFSLS